MRSLLWKEWHEQSWKLAFGAVVLGAFAVIGLHTRIIADEVMMVWVCGIGVTMLPVLSSTGLIPAERAEGSFESLLAMPISPWRILLAKTVIGLLLCVGPMVVAAMVSWMIAGGREMHSASIFDLYGRCALAAALMFFWMLAMTSRLPSEARAGLVATGVLICWILATAGMSNPDVPQWLMFTSPLATLLSWFSGPDDQLPTMVAPLLQTVIVAVLWLVTLKLFGVSNVKES
jgi:hypothetical protein